MLIECARCGKLAWHPGFPVLNPGRVRHGLLCEKCEEIEYAPCDYWRHARGAEADAGFDGGEFSGPAHARALETLEPCGHCPDCLEAAAVAAEGPQGPEDCSF